MKYKNVLAALSVVALSCVASKALDYTYSDYDSWNQYMWAGSSVSGTFNIIHNHDYNSFDGFNPDSEDVTCARVCFTFSDCDWALEYGKIKLGFGTASSWSTDWFEVDSETYCFNLTGDLLNDLQDGILKYKVRVKNDCWSDFTFKCAKLEVCTTPNSPPIPPPVSAPDGGLTVGLLGLGLLGLGAFKLRAAH